MKFNAEESSVKVAHINQNLFIAHNASSVCLSQAEPKAPHPRHRSPPHFGSRYIAPRSSDTVFLCQPLSHNMHIVKLRHNTPQSHRNTSHTASPKIVQHTLHGPYPQLTVMEMAREEQSHALNDLLLTDFHYSCLLLTNLRYKTCSSRAHFAEK